MTSRICVEAIRHFENLILESETRFQFQPAVSPVWDTAICAYALGRDGSCGPPRKRSPGQPTGY